MSQSGAIRRQLGVSYSQLSDGERVSAFLRSLYPERTAANVAADTKGRIPAKTVEKWLHRLSAPSFRHTMVLLGAYGPEFVCACMDHPPAWIDEAARVGRRAAIEARIAALHQQLQRESA